MIWLRLALEQVGLFALGLGQTGPTVYAVLHGICVALAAGHAVLTKHDERAAAGWVGVICLVPLLGPLLYFMLGINRIRRRAVARVPRRKPRLRDAALEAHLAAQMQPVSLSPLQSLVARVAERPLLCGNAIRPLADGEEAYPAMLAAIEGARRSVALCTYIFDRDAAGKHFADALARARRRGVAVRVLIDAVGVRYSWPSIARVLRRQGVIVALFNRTLWPWRVAYANLRCHRKILMVDGEVAFTGGMNIRAGHLVQTHPRHAVHDLHFEVRGPVLGQVWDAFAQDWYDSAGETLDKDVWALQTAPVGDVVARGISDGPDSSINRLHWVLLGALACAQRSVHIVTPYFLPDQALVAALNTTAMRGVEVHVVLPANNNLTLVDWASNGILPQILASGCKVYRVATAFDHTKLMVVDDAWSLIGSANWDPRSLRLNFEYNIECYCTTLAARLRTVIDQRLERSQLVTSASMHARGLARHLRDNVARLMSPYL